MVQTLPVFRNPSGSGALAYGSADSLQWGAAAKPVDFFDVKGDVEVLLAPRVAEWLPAAHPALHPGRSARVVVERGRYRSCG